MMLRSVIISFLIAVLFLLPVSHAEDYKLTPEAMELIADTLAPEQLALFEQTLLHDMASRESRFDSVDFELSSCASPMQPYMPHLSWLTAAYDDPDYTNENVLNAMELVIGSGCDLDEHQHAGLSPLHDAIALKYLDVIEFLLAQGADRDNLVNRPGKKSDKLNAVQLAQLLFSKTGDPAYQEAVRLLKK